MVHQVVNLVVNLQIPKFLCVNRACRVIAFVSSNEVGSPFNDHCPACDMIGNITT